jgi:hypothetical protein
MGIQRISASVVLIDFKKAYDSVKREVLYNILIEFRIPVKPNRRPFNFNFIFGNRKKSQGVKSWKHGGWGMIAILFFAKNCWAKTEV